jgi:hypothetical protein
VPGYVYCQFEELVETLSSSSGKLALKIDQRWGIANARALARTGHPVFMLAHDSRPKNVIRTIRRAATCQSVSYAAMSLSVSDNRYVVLFARFEGDDIWYLSPATQLGTELVAKALKAELELHFLAGNELDALSGSDVLRPVIGTCFDRNIAAS